jgi:hypothetical protein
LSSRHPESQGSVERSNGEVKKLLGTWIRETKSMRWSFGIKFVQFQYNAKVNRNLDNKSPFKAIFGFEPPLGLKSTIIPSSKWQQLHVEQDLIRIMKKVTVNGEEVDVVGEVEEMEDEDVDEEEEGNYLLIG